MPVKWTPETDQILLLKILETSHVSTDAKAISAAWPESHETPTPRAISERIFKIKSMAKSSSSSSSSSSAPSSPQKIKSDSSTSRPIKSDKKDAAAPPKATGSPRSKRKRAGASTGTKAESNGHSFKFEQPVPDDDLYGDDSLDSTETKKVKSNPTTESAETAVPDVLFGLN